MAAAAAVMYLWSIRLLKSGRGMRQ